MSYDSESITINCPFCDEKHTYSLEIERSTVFKMMTFDDMQESPQRVRFTRLFTCPKELKDFQVTFILFETSSSPIKSVEIINHE